MRLRIKLQKNDTLTSKAKNLRHNQPWHPPNRYIKTFDMIHDPNVRNAMTNGGGYYK